MIFIRLALKSIANRRLTSFLTVFSIALSAALLLAVERTKRASEEGFTNAVSGTDLIVGARSGPLNLILYTVFNIGNATNNISWKTYEEIRQDPNVEWTIPYSLGDGHRGFRVVATDENFYRHYRYRGGRAIEMREGQPASDLWDAVLGADVAARLNYRVGERIALTHGVTRGEGVLQHDDKPFTVSGILKPTGTAIDQSIYITLEGMEAIHLDWKDGAVPSRETALSPEQIRREDLKVGQITAFFLRTKSRIETLRLQRRINEFAGEALSAVIPGVALAELWRNLSSVEKVLKVISWMVIGVGLTAMLIALLTSLNERRREMAIFRALGAGPGRLAALLIFESGALTIGGILLGLALEQLGFVFLRHWLEGRFGLYLVGSSFTGVEAFYLGIMILLGLLIGLFPAVLASRRALKDGLTIRI